MLAARLASGQAIPPERAADLLALKNRGLGSLEEGRNREAAAAFARLAQMLPEEPLAVADEAVAEIRSGDFAAAEKHLSRAQSLAPGRADLYEILAALESARRRPAQARAALSRAAALSAGALEARWRWIHAADLEPSLPGRVEQTERYLEEIVRASPANLPALARLLLVRVESGKASATAALASLESVTSPSEPRVARYLGEGRTLLKAGKPHEAALKFRIVENLLRVTDRYRQSLAEIYTDVVGLPLTAFSAKLEGALRPRAGPPIPVKFSESRRAPAELSPERLLRRADLLNRGAAEEYAIPEPFRRAAFLDYDDDGDLDVYLHGSGGADRLLRNNADGTWQDATAATGDAHFSSSRVFVEDLDRDGDLDLLCTTKSGLVWRSNLRQGRFQTFDLGVPGAIDAVAGDLDADGWPDIVAVTRGAIVLLVNRGDGKFERVPGGDLARLPAGFVPRCVILADFDNDGFLDVAVGGEAGILMFRNSGLHTFTAWPIAPRGVGRVDEMAAIDADGDGGLDLAVSDNGHDRLFLNEGGSANGWLDVTLRGLSSGSQKVNRAGVGSLVEVKAGDLYAARTVSLLPTHVGLGRRAKAEVVRVVWTNGVPQNLFDQKARTVVAEVQQLKGSCPFVYALDGASGRWSFVSDALGRAPLGLLYDGVHLAGADTREWLKIDGRLLSPDSRNTLRIDFTEELWEAAFLDMVHLAAVDHPAGTDFVPNERMVPGVLEKKLFAVADPRPVRAASSGGRDVSDELSSSDHRYVRPGEPTAYQGIRTDHDLVLDLGPIAPGQRVVLFLEGWIFYTDTSINVAVSQRHDLVIRPPVLEIPDGRGGWKTGIESFGFPAGKTKTMPVDLTGVVDPADPRVRIRTNMEIYWDRAYVQTGEPDVELRWSELSPSRAVLAFRGFSRRFRETEDGPELFDHDAVDRGPHWADVPGLLTRYGDVTPLLSQADDRWVAFEGGDAVSLEFDASALPALPAGFVRDWVLVSDGWDKDFDKNTVTGTSIAPYPFHAMTAYPYPDSEKHPDPAFLRRWLTRRSSPEAFFSAVRDAGGEPVR
jgi:tetratricopeptide (TPR) repeat protein